MSAPSVLNGLDARPVADGLVEVIQPTLDTGVSTLVTAALAWLAPTPS